MFNTNSNLGKRNSSDEKRISFLIWGAIFLTFFCSYELFSKSVLEHKNYLAMAKDQYIIEKQLPSSRGLIYFSDKNSYGGYYPMATNEDKYQVLVVPKNIKDKTSTAQQLAKILNIDEKELFDAINNDKPYIPPIAKKQSKETVANILGLKLDGVMIMAEKDRLYPEDNLASQIVGFLDAENVGRYGVEGYYNNNLTGKSGEIVGEKDIFGRFISEENKINPQNGDNLYLTIDRNIQYMAMQYLNKNMSEMKADRGSIIIVEAKTGKIMAMASNPDYNPNSYFDTAKDHPDYFTNPIISNEYEPGSIMKPIVMSMAIDSGKVQPDTEDIFGGSVTVQGYTIQNAMFRTFGKETMTKVLENSDNVAMVWVSQKLDFSEMRKYFEKYGFGKITDIDLDGEAAGNLLAIDDWRDISRATMAFGQGVSVTPLQMVMAYQAIANEGKLMKPYIVDKIVKDNGDVVETQPKQIEEVVSRETANKVKDMLVSVVDNGYDLQGKVAGYKVAGKTGTAQIPKSDGGYEETDTIHSFAGFLPANDPKYVVLIILNRPKKFNFASSTIAPYFSKIASWLLNYAEIKPTENQ